MSETRIDNEGGVQLTINISPMALRAFHKARVEREAIEGRVILESTFLRECVNQTVQRILYGEK